LKATEYLELADELVTRDQEAALRTAVSRAYYAVFNSIAGFYESQGIKFAHNDNKHRKYHDVLQNCGSTELQVLAETVASLHAERKKADYNLSDARLRKKQVCEAAVVSAHDCIKCFDLHRDKSVEGARQYCAKVLRLPLASRVKQTQ